MPLSDKDLKNKESLVKWLINFHNIVNEMKEKPIIKYIEARKLIDTNTQCVQSIKTIERFTNNNKSSSNNTLCILLALFIGLIIIAIVYKKK